MYRDWAHTTQRMHDERRAELASAMGRTSRPGALRRIVGAWLQGVGRRLAGDGIPRVDLADSLR